MAVIRPATIQDMPGVYRVCLQSGDSGRDATSMFQNPDLLGHVYVGPYLIGSPQLAFVVADSEGIAGYTFAVEDTIAFEEWERQHWWPALREQYPLAESTGRPLKDEDEFVIRLLHNPEFAPRDIAAEYPAHMHIDLLPRVHGMGFGRQLMELAAERLRERKIAGVHLAVSPENANALDFYRHLGYTVLQQEPDVVYMGAKLS